MKIKLTNKLLLIIAMFGLLGTWSCQKWNEEDPESGNQVYPKVVLKGDYDIDAEFPDGATLKEYDNGQVPVVEIDDSIGYVADLTGGYLSFINPLNDVTLQNGISVTMWLKTSGESVDGAICSFTNADNSQYLYFTENGGMGYASTETTYDEINNSADTITNLLSADEWHFIAILFGTDSYSYYVDGEEALNVALDDFDFETALYLAPNYTNFKVGFGSSTQPDSLWVDDIKVYRNIIGDAKIAVPTKTNDAVGNYAFPPEGTVGYYKLNNNFLNDLDASLGGELVTSEEQATPSDYEEDSDRGTVWNQQEGWSGHDNGYAYTQFSNPLYGETLEDGVSVSMWLNPTSEDYWDQVFCLYDETSRFWFNCTGYVGYNGSGGWFDCQQDNSTNMMTIGEWTFVTVNITEESFEVYYNGEFKFSLDDNGVYNASMTDFSQVQDLFTTSSYFYLGYGSFWSAAPALVDDIFLVSRTLESAEIENLYTNTVKTNGGLNSEADFLPSLYGYYGLNSNFKNALDASQSGELVTSEEQTTPSDFEEDNDRGIVWNQQEGWSGHDNGYAYTRFDNPLYGVTTDGGVSVSMWLNPTSEDYWDQVFCLYDETSRFWFNCTGYVGYNGSGGWFDCQQDNSTNMMTVGEWTFITLNVTSESFEVYYNGEFKFSLDDNDVYNASMTDFSQVLDLFLTSSNYYLGYGSYWSAAPALVDDIYMCASTLTEDQALALYNATK